MIENSPHKGDSDDIKATENKLHTHSKSII